jgi:hypothetical protein
MIEVRIRSRGRAAGPVGNLTDMSIIDLDRASGYWIQKSRYVKPAAI